ncbi:DUF4230 domain-containing protein [Sandaracinus amylolyticus]|uniref:DUF4230 domain-containing protein n=1 Tax=Sandaracinus amylolyticus TaxID=927083 RepID=UPI001F18BD88|nr:DUF4230 domain-containing protein [Sandaracinus amylolyticus]UJR86270.1 Hypothetical protein I5071_83520 [Sandaracinus amylolyticus]
MRDEKNDVSNEREPRAPSGPQRRVVRGGAWVLVVLLMASIGAGVVQLGWNLAHVAVPDGESRTVRSGPDVVVAVRDLARLESASFHMERVIELTSTQRRVFGLLEAEDSILLVAAADVIAGVDLSELREGDVVVDPETRRVRVTLPPARVLSARLDSERTFVHSRRTDVLAMRREQLESEARREAERTLQASAIEAGILERASTNAERTVEALVRSLGYQDVVVDVRPSGPVIEAPR